MAGIESDFGTLNSVVLHLAFGLKEFVEGHGKPEVSQIEAEDLKEPDNTGAKIDELAKQKDQNLLRECELDVEYNVRPIGV